MSNVKSVEPTDGETEVGYSVMGEEERLLRWKWSKYWYY